MQTLRVLALILAVSFLGSSAIPAKALDRDDRCHRHVEQAEHNLDKAVRRHGEHSPQAERRRHDLEEARERCRHDHDRDHDNDHDHH